MKTSYRFGISIQNKFGLFTKAWNKYYQKVLTRHLFIQIIAYCVAILIAGKELCTKLVTESQKHLQYCKTCKIGKSTM